MDIQEIIQLRLHNQLISHYTFLKPAEVVAWMGAMQAQDYPGAKWSIALRLPAASDADIENAIGDRRFVRTWPMRGTLHFVAAADVRWMLKLLTSRVIANSAGRYKQLELDEKIFAKAKDILTRVLEGGKNLTRQALFQAFEAKGIHSGNQRGIHIIQKHAMEGLICFGSHEGKQPTFVLLDEWIPVTPVLAREEALAELARRYFTSHGPAMLKDFIWWTGLITASAKEAIELAKPSIAQLKINSNDYWYNPEMIMSDSKSNEAFLLPGFDEFVLGYTNRSGIIQDKHLKKLTPGGGTFNPTLVLNENINGTWKRIIKKNKIDILITPFTKMTSDQRKAVDLVKEKYIRYIIL
jgi:hypothetical protein